ncbi:DUF262 domain-containing protein [Corynebacterium liangguodongii]|uniref:GmrSD restriction endonucleases N-terminal domain-containing protein n=1 Tax=Corynebacterium liangguodongii TaxID=2079535 RepID=A0A2S0WDR6_9CORY|nr:DUF262 domain-containing protein [Corynebacterium liangguodongii]AWB83874.1 hypothetical protein C3E79_04755 [Corynebacterium liangguodongii]PWB99013.1 DUF262 domain-containing protein [Corynebacterium liangguodongii]
MGFTTPSYSLTDLFSRAGRGELQLPDFQHDVVFDVDRVRSLVTTVLRGYPVGAFLALDTRNVAPRFASRPINGVAGSLAEPGLLLLDGQQRLTALYQAFGGDGTGDGGVETFDLMGRRIVRRFFVDIRRAVSADPMPVEAVFAVDEKGAVRSHFGPEIPGGIAGTDDMIAHGVIPVSLLLHARGSELLFDIAAATANPEVRGAAAAFHARVASQLNAYSIPVMRIERDTPLTGIGQIFAHVNSAGVKMDVFDLLTAAFTLEDPEFSLPAHWQGVERQLRSHPALEGIGRIEFLRAVSLFVTAGQGTASGHRGDILSLTVADYVAAADEVVEGFAAAARFLSERFMFHANQVPYTAQIVSLAVVLARLGGQQGASEGGGVDGESQSARDRLNRWFWSGVFGELYGAHSPMIRAASDVDEVTPWVRGETDQLPRTVADARCERQRIATAGPESGVYRALGALLMARGARDWRTGMPFTSDTIAELEPSLELVFPPEVCRAQGVDPALLRSAVGRTPMGIRTRLIIESTEPRRYLPRLQSKSLLDDAEFDAVIRGHDIAPEHLLASDAAAFFADRLDRLVALVEHAMGTRVAADEA